MKIREITQSVLRHWTLGAMALAIALAVGLSGQVATTPVDAQTPTVPSQVTTVIHFPNHTPLPCFSAICIANEQVGPFGSVVHDKATVTSGDVTKDPTGNVRFAFFTNLHCMGTPSNSHLKVVSAGGGVGTAESNSTAALQPGDYSYRAVYFPDTAAKALGFGNSTGPCEQLRIIKVKSGTLIHHADAVHTPLDCFNAGNCPGGGQKANAPATVHDLATVDSGDATRTPTGFVRFAFYVNELECRTVPASIEDVTVSGSGAVTTAESSNVGPLAAGVYSYKAIYFPDAAAIALGLGSSPANCEQLLIE